MDAPVPAEPQTLDRLHRLARDLAWCWHEVAQRPFAMIDPARWESSNHEPAAVLLDSCSGRRAAVLRSPEFLAALDAAEAELERYHATPGWFTKRFEEGDRAMRVAYFCSEFAIHESLPQYSGGLGVLAGDHVKAASDLGLPLVGVGLLYKHGYYVQRLAADGSTRVVEPNYDFRRLPLEETGNVIRCPVGDHDVVARIWRMQVGRVPVYLLDADLPENRPEDRELTEGLYKGEPLRRMRQQALLGVGGVRMLHAVGEHVSVDHLNEGHAAFACIERLREFMNAGATREEAIGAVRRRTVFTTHTPVPAGHDRYETKSVVAVMKTVLDEAGLKGEEFVELGLDPGDADGKLCMTVLALRLAARANGVARLHGRVSRTMWRHLYDVADTEQVPITSITNGVHTQTWLDPAAEAFWRQHIGLTRERISPDTDPWVKADEVDRAALWRLRNDLRARLVRFVRDRLAVQARRRGAAPEEVLASARVFDDRALTIGFARRFATYKRAPLIFRDPDRLAKLLSDPQRPVQLVFAGKAHPADESGQRFLREIFAFTRDPRFAGRVAVIEDYDMHVGRMLTSGCDVWLNNPIRPHEASGTSGMKPPLHGGLNCSILDGWWPEGWDGRNGWAIGDESEELEGDERDARDAESLYTLLEKEISREFWSRDEHGLPRRWLDHAAHSAASIPGRFSTHRMVGEYVRRLYLPAHRAGLPAPANAG